MSRSSRKAPTSEEDVIREVEALVEGSGEAPKVTTGQGVVMGFAVFHDGKYGYVVHELELPRSVVERYCTKQHPPDIKAGALARIESRIIKDLSQNPIKATLTGNLLGGE